MAGKNKNNYPVISGSDPNQNSKLQSMLKQHGLYQDGEVDGIWGPKSKKAWKEFNKGISSQNIPELNVYGNKTTLQPQLKTNAPYTPQGSTWTYYNNADTWVDQKSGKTMGREDYEKAYPKQLRKANYHLPEYSLGGWLKENSQGVIGGLKLVGGAALSLTGVGAGAGIGLMSSGVSDLGQELTDGNQSQALEDQRLAQNKANINAALSAGANSVPQYTMAYGGMIPGGIPNAELEKQEVVQSPQGDMMKVNAPSHAQGGIDVSLPTGSRVFSDKLKPKNSNKTYADLANELKKQIEKLEKKLNK